MTPTRSSLNQRCSDLSEDGQNPKPHFKDSLQKDAQRKKAHKNKFFYIFQPYQKILFLLHFLDMRKLVLSVSKFEIFQLHITYQQKHVATEK